MDFTGERLIPGAADKELEIEHLDRYRFASQFAAGKAVLDAACGAGYGTAILAKAAEKAVGIDISEEAVDYARKLYSDEKTEYTVASVGSLPFPDNSFDTVVSFETLEHVDSETQSAFLKEVGRVLRTDGILVISTPNREIYDKRGINEFHVRELSYAEFGSFLKEQFRYVRFYTQKWEICDAIIGEDAGTAQLSNGLAPEEAEYLIAVCSQNPLPVISTQVTVNADSRLAALMNWALENDQRNTASNEHIFKLDEEIKGYQKELSERRELCDKQAQELRSKEGHIEQLLESERSLKRQVSEQEECIAEQEELIEQQTQELCNRDGHIELLLESERGLNRRVAELEQELKNKEGHIALLLESERELQRIKSSRSWRFMGFFWKLRDAIIPKGSKRRLIAKMLVNAVRHPFRFLRKCSPKRIGKFFSYLRREGAENVSRRLDNCLIGTEIQKVPLKVEALPSNSQKTEERMAAYSPLAVPDWSNPTVSVVIPVYNQFDYTYLCVKSILEHSGDVTFEIIIADDCSTDLTENIADIISGLHIVRNAENLRFLRNCNNAAKQARGKYILFLNNDTQVQENWLAPLVELIERRDDIGMVGSKLVYPDGRLQEAGGILWKDGSAWNYGHGSDPSLPEYNYVKEADYISGAAIMIRRRLWEEIGGFDDRFAPAYCEDSDLAFEVRRHGYKVMYQPLSVVVHFEGVSNGTDLSSGQKAYQVENQKKFYEKWKDVLESEHFPNGENVFSARDRSAHKKTLLMVDHYVPHFDKDAGSRTVFQYLRLFIDKGYRIKFIGDNFYPHQPYTTVLQQMGIEVLYGSWYAEHWKQWVAENGDQIQYVFLNRPHISVKYIDELRAHTDARIVYYGHDLHFLRERREYELTKDKAKLGSSEEWKEKELALMRKSDMAYYPSSVEVEEIHRIDPNIRVKAIPAYLFSDIKKPEYRADTRRDMMFIGGFGHSPNVDAVKWLAKEIVPKLEKELPDAKVYILGSNPSEEIKALETERLRIIGFVTDEELERYYTSCRLAVVPLRYGAGIKGKVVEAMRFGLPVVTTSVGAEGIIGAEQFLVIADDGKNFAEKAAALYQNDEELTARSEESFRYVLENFSPENARQIICSEFDME